MSAAADSDLPESVRAVARVIGREKTFALIGKLYSRPVRQRSKFYVPARITRGILALLDRADAEKMVKEFPNHILELPKTAAMTRRYRDEAIRAAHARGASVAALAWSFDLTPRAVRYICRGMTASTETAERERTSVAR